MTGGLGTRVQLPAEKAFSPDHAGVSPRVPCARVGETRVVPVTSSVQYLTIVGRLVPFTL